MIVSRFKTQVGENLVRHRTVVETDTCIKGTLHSRTLRQELLKYIADDPFFSHCGGVDFEEMRLKHDGSKWVVEFSAALPK